MARQSGTLREPSQANNDFGEYQQRRMIVRRDASVDSQGGGRDVSKTPVEVSAAISANAVCKQEGASDIDTLTLGERPRIGTIGMPVAIERSTSTHGPQ